MQMWPHCPDGEPSERLRRETTRYIYYPCAGEEVCRQTYIREEQLDDQVRALLASIAIPEDAKA
jgi:hypothetical protein